MKLVIIRGLPGSGKTTAAKELFKGCIHCEADQYFYRLGKGEYLFNANRLKQAHQWCQRKVERNLANGFSCVVANTFVRMFELRPYLDMAEKYGAEVEIYEAAGNYGSVHNVPKETIARMKANWEPMDGKYISLLKVFKTEEK